MNLTKPSEKLKIYYSKVSAGGKAQRPSYLIQELSRLYPKLKVQDEEARKLKEKELNGEKWSCLSDPWTAGEESGPHLAGIIYLVSEISGMESCGGPDFARMVLQTSGRSIIGTCSKRTLWREFRRKHHENGAVCDPVRVHISLLTGSA